MDWRQETRVTASAGRTRSVPASGLVCWTSLNDLGLTDSAPEVSDRRVGKFMQISPAFGMMESTGLSCRLPLPLTRNSTSGRSFVLDRCTFLPHHLPWEPHWNCDIYFCIVTNYTEHKMSFCLKELHSVRLIEMNLFVVTIFREHIYS